jgi:DNA-binding MarR family transcriptional regulator
MEQRDVRAFRRDLRALEREVMLSLTEDTDCCGITVSQCHLLMEAEDRSSTNVTELAAALSLDKSTLSRTVDGLCRRGYLSRATHPEQRRQQVIRLTGKGTAKAEAINTTCDASHRRLFDFIPADKRDMVVEAVALLAAAMRQRRVHPESACCAEPKTSGRIQ